LILLKISTITANGSLSLSCSDDQAVKKARGFSNDLSRGSKASLHVRLFLNEILKLDKSSNEMFAAEPILGSAFFWCLVNKTLDHLIATT
jgi:hypothetical protein